MKQLINELGNFFSSLQMHDIVFFVSVMALIILGVTVFYLIKTSKENDIEEISAEDLFDLRAEDEDDLLPPAEDEPERLIDLATLTRSLDDADYDAIDINKYEEEQEEKAIISYEELLEQTGSMQINYAEEEDKDGISVKRVDLDNIATRIEEEKPEPMKVQLVSYDKEEAFLQALKDLKSMLS